MSTGPVQVKLPLSPRFELFHRRRIHPEHFPDVAIKVVEASGIHGTMILRGPAFRGTSTNGLVVDRFHRILAIAGKGQQCFRCFRCVSDGSVFRDEAFHVPRSKQHAVDGIADDKARGILIAELRIEAIAELFEEVLALGEVLHVHVDEDLCGHVVMLSWMNFTEKFLPVPAYR